MFCRKCGRQIEDRASFCRYCGTEVAVRVSPGDSNKKKSVSRGEHRWVSPKNALALTICVVLLGLVVFLLWAKPQSQYDWESTIRADLLSGTSTIEKSTADAVKISVEEENGQIIVNIRAPYICEELLAWMENTSEEDFGEEQMEEEILRLLKTVDDVESTHTLNYVENNGAVEIAYSQEFADRISCGLARFYNELTKRVLEELGGEV